MSDATYGAFVKSSFFKEVANASMPLKTELLKTGVISNQEYIKSQTEKKPGSHKPKRRNVEKIIEPPQKFIGLKKQRK